jgi:hypothetical protein
MKIVKTKIIEFISAFFKQKCVICGSIADHKGHNPICSECLSMTYHVLLPPPPPVTKETLILRTKHDTNFIRKVRENENNLGTSKNIYHKIMKRNFSK